MKKIYLIDDSNLNDIDVSFLKQHKLDDILIKINNIKDYNKLISNNKDQLLDAACIMVHLTFNKSNYVKEELIEISEDNSIPLIVFSASGEMFPDFDGVEDMTYKVINKNIFYERLNFFLDNYFKTKKLDFRLIMLGKDYIKNEVYKLELEIFKRYPKTTYDVSNINSGNTSSESNKGSMFYNYLKRFVELASPEINVDYEQIKTEIENESINKNLFIYKINKIVNSFTQYGKNIYPWN